METQTILFIGIAFMVVALIVSILLLLNYVGAFAGVDLRKGQPSIGSMKIAYKYCREYASNVDDMFLEVVRACTNRKLVTIYFDNPADYSGQLNAKLRFCVGCVLEESDGSDGGNFSEKDNEELMEKLAKDGFKEKQIPKIGDALHCQYPFTCTASLSYAERKVFSSISQVVQVKQWKAFPIIELCDASKTTIHYAAPLERNDEFLVPEFEADQEPVIAAQADASSDLSKKDN